MKGNIYDFPQKSHSVIDTVERFKKKPSTHKIESCFAEVSAPKGTAGQIES